MGKEETQTERDKRQTEIRQRNREIDRYKDRYIDIEIDVKILILSFFIFRMQI